jgi:glycosyltransferase involved in cell wall biosynthesis
MIKRVLIVLPMYNEENSIVSTLTGLIPICKDNSYDILIVDDGSDDNSYKVSKDFISTNKVANISLMRLPFNCGVGAAMRSGFTWAHSRGYSSVVQFDSDGQHDPFWISKLIEESEEFDIVVGSRFQLSEKFTSGFRRFTMHILSQAIRLRTRFVISDPTSGFRLTNSRAIEVFAHQYPTEYLGDTLNSLVVAHSYKFRVAETPVKMHKRRAGEPSTGLLKSALYLIRSIFSIVMYQSPRRKNE